MKDDMNSNNLFKMSYDNFQLQLQQDLEKLRKTYEPFGHFGPCLLDGDHDY